MHGRLARFCRCCRLAVVLCITNRPSAPGNVWRVSGISCIAMLGDERTFAFWSHRTVRDGWAACSLSDPRGPQTRCVCPHLTWSASCFWHRCSSDFVRSRMRYLQANGPKSYAMLVAHQQESVRGTYRSSDVRQSHPGCTCSPKRDIAWPQEEHGDRTSSSHSVCFG